MNFSNVVIILCRPEESRNVGAVCRAMANNSLKTLRIVGKKEDFDEERVRILAIHAASIWENAQFFDSITEASKDCTIVAGTTRRRGKKRGNFCCLKNSQKALTAFQPVEKLPSYLEMRGQASKKKNWTSARWA